MISRASVSPLSFCSSTAMRRCPSLSSCTMLCFCLVVSPHCGGLGRERGAAFGFFFIGFLGTSFFTGFLRMVFFVLVFFIEVDVRAIARVTR